MIPATFMNTPAPITARIVLAFPEPVDCTSIIPIVPPRFHIPMFICVNTQPGIRYVFVGHGYYALQPVDCLTVSLSVCGIEDMRLCNALVQRLLGKRFMAPAIPSRMWCFEANALDLVGDAEPVFEDWDTRTLWEPPSRRTITLRSVLLNTHALEAYGPTPTELMAR